jgi:hypothetical protein
MIVTIAWNPLGFHLLDALPKGSDHAAVFYEYQTILDGADLSALALELLSSEAVSDVEVTLATRCLRSL